MSENKQKFTPPYGTISPYLYAEQVAKGLPTPMPKTRKPAIAPYGTMCPHHYDYVVSTGGIVEPPSTKRSRDNERER